MTKQEKMSEVSKMFLQGFLDVYAQDRTVERVIFQIDLKDNPDLMKIAMVKLKAFKKTA